MRTLVGLLILAVAAWADGGSVLLRNGTIHPVSGPAIERGSVLVEDGKITGVGKSVSAPRGVKIVDVRGLHVYPGMIDSGTQIGLSEIPQQCRLAQEVRWALKMAPQIGDYAQARAAVDEHFAGMHPVHTINNACLTVWGLTIGGTDLTRVIAETVAMGRDNDCTAATAGSIAGAVVGKKGVEAHWVDRFEDTVHSYLIDQPRFSISGLVERFATQARKVHGA